MAVDLSSYLTVAQRIAEFREKHPEGALQPVNLDEPFKVVTIGDRTFISYVAAAYRTADDKCPGIGVAWEPFPGRTPYTKDSELMNAETSAWGRAIVAVLASDTTKGIATREEIANRQSERDSAQERHPANVRKLPDRRPANIDENGEIAGLQTAVNLTNLVKAAKEAKTLDSLREVWKDVGNAGLLNENLAKAGISPGMTFQEFLYERSDELGSPKSDAAGHSDPAGNGAAAPKAANRSGRAKLVTFVNALEGMVIGGSLVITAETPIDHSQWADGKPWHWPERTKLDARGSVQVLPEILPVRVHPAGLLR